MYRCEHRNYFCRLLSPVEWSHGFQQRHTVKYNLIIVDKLIILGMHAGAIKHHHGYHSFYLIR
jgi:hypothetical protein